METITRYIPDYVPPGSPNLDRFGTKSSLYSEIEKVGFSNIVVKEFVFYHNSGKFEDLEKLSQIYSKTGKREDKQVGQYGEKGVEGNNKGEHHPVRQQTWRDCISLASFNSNSRILGIRRQVWY